MEFYTFLVTRSLIFFLSIRQELESEMKKKKNKKSESIRVEIEF